VKYACLIYSSQEEWDALPPEEHARVYERSGELERELTSSGRLARGAELQPASTATTVRVRGGETIVTDGPFAETREQLGGFLVLECESMEEALEVARRIPSAERGAIEVRRESPAGGGEAAA
jgi:hypothetical protein